RDAPDLTMRQPEDEGEAWDEAFALEPDDENGDEENGDAETAAGDALAADADDAESLMEDHWVEEIGLSMGAPALPRRVADDDESLFEDHWVEEFGLSIGAPALRHLVADEHEQPGAAEEYAAGHEPAYALYGDLSRLEAFEADDASYDDASSEYEEDVEAVDD